MNLAITLVMSMSAFHPLSYTNTHLRNEKTLKEEAKQSMNNINWHTYIKIIRFPFPCGYSGIAINSTY